MIDHHSSKYFDILEGHSNMTTNKYYKKIRQIGPKSQQPFRSFFTLYD